MIALVVETTCVIITSPMRGAERFLTLAQHRRLHEAQLLLTALECARSLHRN